MRYVIVGNGPAAVNAVEAIRTLDGEGSITLFSEEPEFTYSRPLISYLLAGETDEKRMRYREADFYERNRVDFRQGVAVTRICPEDKTVQSADGSVTPYDRLLLATGSRPFVPPADGLENVPYHTLMTLADARALRSALMPTSRVLIVGAGLIGLKCLEGIRALCAQVTVLDLAEQILPSILDRESAALVQAHLEKQQVDFILGDCVAQYTPGLATTKAGRKIPFDVLVMVVGVRPATQLACDLGLEAARGIVTDENGETAIPGIFAAGDCVQSGDIVTGQRRVLALLPNAAMQGEACGLAMAGGTPVHRGYLPMNAMGLFGMHLITAGIMAGESHVVRTDGTYKRLWTKEDRLMGYILVGNVARAGIYTALIREQTPLHTIDFALMLDQPQLMAFSKADRQIRMGGSRL